MKKVWYSISAFLSLSLIAVACGLLAWQHYQEEKYVWSSLLALGGVIVKIAIPFVLGMILGQPIKRLFKNLAAHLKWRKRPP